MGKLTDDLKRLLDDAIGSPNSNSSSKAQGSGFGYGQDSGSYQVPDLSQSLSNPNLVTPDALKQSAFDQGYIPPERIDPFQLNVAEINAVTSDRPTPFTTIDLAPYATIPPRQTEVDTAGSGSPGVGNVINNLGTISGLFIGMSVNDPTVPFPTFSTLPVPIPVNTTVTSITSTALGIQISANVMLAYGIFTYVAGIKANGTYNSLTFLNSASVPFIGQICNISSFGTGAGSSTIGSVTAVNNIVFNGTSYNYTVIFTGTFTVISPGRPTVNFTNQPTFAFTPPPYVTQNTLDNGARSALISFLNISQNEIYYFNQLASFSGYPQGFDYFSQQCRTVQINVLGDSFRMERLPGGSATTTVGGSAAQGVPFHVGEPAASSDSPQGEPFIYPLIAKYSKFFTGCYVQFDSTSNPIFRCKPGEVYRQAFNTLYITFFIADPRYRIIVGRKALIDNVTDDRVLRQSLHVWDANMILDNQAVHPVPFDAFPNDYYAVGALGGSVRKYITGNYDSGTGLTPTGPGAGIGNVSNHGYGVLWITSITAYVGTFFDVTQNNGPVYIKISKGVYHRKTQSITNAKQLFTGLIPGNAGRGENAATFSLATPIRVVLAGFDSVAGNNNSPYTYGESGEVLYIEMFNGTQGGANMTYTISGYAMGWINIYASGLFPEAYQPTGANYAGVSAMCTVPNNSYPLDVGFDIAGF